MKKYHFSITGQWVPSLQPRGVKCHAVSGQLEHIVTLPTCTGVREKLEFRTKPNFEQNQFKSYTDINLASNTFEAKLIALAIRFELVQFEIQFFPLVS